MEEQAGGISRRRVVVGTAWLTPAIVLAVAVPRAAASGEVVVNGNVLQIDNVTGWAQGTTEAGINAQYEYNPGAAGFPVDQVGFTSWVAEVIPEGGGEAVLRASGMEPGTTVPGGTVGAYIRHFDDVALGVVTAGRYFLRLSVSLEPIIADGNSYQTSPNPVILDSGVVQFG